jgi:hypothetical protein
MLNNYNFNRRVFVLAAKVFASLCGAITTRMAHAPDETLLY